MPFDPTKPVANSLISSAELRDQFNALKALIAGSVLIGIQGTGSSGSTEMECELQTAFGVASPTKTFCTGSNLPGFIRIHITITNASAGTVQLQANNASNTNTVTIKAKSDLVARKTS